jgi:site-specific DNA recombinase
MKTYVGYVRVSTAKQGQQGSSLQEQRDAILAFAKRHEYRIVEWYEDRETAAKKGRTQFMRMMAVLEKGKATGVILHKIDRGARNLWDWARIQDLIDAGIDVHFAHDNLDLKSRGGRLAADIQAVVAADYVRNLRDEVLKGMRGRLKQGLYPWRAPIGYLNQGKAKPKIIDPIKGPLVRAAFDLYTTKRHTYYTLALELHRLGLRTGGGKPLSLSSITWILRNPFYIGVIRMKGTGEVFQGVHEPLIDARTFQRAQDIIDGRENEKVRRFDFIFRRLLECGLCGHVLTGERQKGKVYYRCHTRECDTTGIREDAVTAIFKGVTDNLPFGDSDYMEMKPFFEDEERTAAADQTKIVGALKLRIAAIEDRGRRLTDAYLDQVLDRESYQARRTALLTELATARDDLRRAELEQNGNGDERIREFFERLKTFKLGPQSGLLAEYRDTVEKMTSNRSLIREDLCITMRSPFKEIIQDTELLLGAPHRNGFRTFEGQKSPKGERISARSLPEQRAHLLLKHLADWTPSKSFSDAGNEDKPRRETQPHWFKPNEPPRMEGDAQTS